VAVFVIDLGCDFVPFSVEVELMSKIEEVAGRHLERDSRNRQLHRLNPKDG